MDEFTIDPKRQKEAIRFAKSKDRDQSLKRVREHFVEWWSGRSPEEIQRELEKVRQKVIREEQTFGDIEGELAGPM